jgi:hypothetical protein
LAGITLVLNIMLLAELKRTFVFSPNISGLINTNVLQMWVVTKMLFICAKLGLNLFNKQ